MGKIPDPWSRVGLLVGWFLSTITIEGYHYIKGNSYPIEIIVVKSVVVLIIMMVGSALFKLWWNYMGDNKKPEGKDEKN